MRPLIAAVAATAALSLNPASAADLGVGTAAVADAGFFRPGIGIAGAGECTYAVTTLKGEAVSMTIAPGDEKSVTISCSLRNAAGSTILSGYATGTNHASVTRTVLGGQVPVTICTTFTAESWRAGVPTIGGTTCAAVLPGNLR
ncbi:MAG TPA: hypothetical protein VNQ77_07065 [Frankiaceae bacterium]|nr:hypothetical protein [Frankiaceae bacterium]